MTFRSVLFEGTVDDRAKETPEAPECFADLNLDQVINTITAGRQEYHLKPFFYTPLKDIATIQYRQEIAQDLENETLLEIIKSFARQMVIMRRYLTLLDQLDFRRHKEGWFLEAAEVYCDAVSHLAHSLSQVDLKSRGLIAFREYLTRYANSDAFVALHAETEKVKRDLSIVAYCVLSRTTRSRFANTNQKLITARTWNGPSRNSSRAQ